MRAAPGIIVIYDGPADILGLLAMVAILVASLAIAAVIIVAAVVVYQDIVSRIER